MKIMEKNTTIVALMLLVFMILLITGCGSYQEAKNTGCPKGSQLANSTDKFSDFNLSPVDRYVLSTSPEAVGGVLYIPEPNIVVTDATGVPRNNICVVVTTNGIWWTDNNYTTELVGSGVNNEIIAITNDNGAITLHWSTYPLPLSSAATSTTADGKDFDYPAALIGVSSGAVSKLYSAAVSVKGCPKETFGPPATCP